MSAHPVTAADSSGTLKIWRPPDLGTLELHLGTSFQHSYPRHWHEEFFISAITAGAGHFDYRGNAHLATPGTLVLVVPGEVHAHYDCAGGRSFRSIHMPWSFVADITSEVLHRTNSSPGFFSRLIADARLFRAFLRLHRLMETRGTRLHRESLLLSFFAGLIRRVGGSAWPAFVAGREWLAVRRAQEFLEEHYGQQVSLGDLAALSNLSRFHFHRVFYRRTGMPPHAYQIQLRMIRAKALLRKRWPIAHVAQLTGFADQSHFTRHFKRLVGLTPGQYAGHSKNVQDSQLQAG